MKRALVVKMTGARVLIALALSAAGCAAPMPSPMLINARQELETAQAAPNAGLVKESLVRAQQALAEAEAAHEKQPWSEADQSFTYVAQRRAELAIAQGEIARMQLAPRRVAEPAAVASEAQRGTERLTSGQAQVFATATTSRVTSE